MELHPITMLSALVIPNILNVLNLYWFHLMIKGAIKVFFYPDSKED